MKETAIVIGASSGLGRSLCEHLAERGCDLILSSRNIKELTATAETLETKFNIKANVLPIDLAKTDNLVASDYVKQCFEISPSIKQVYITAAIANNSDSAETSAEIVHEIFDTNFFGVVILFSALASRLRDIPSNITVISSVAAIRPRSKNVSYSSSKIALENFILGLKHHYADSKINIQLYRAGYMDTPMSAGKKFLFPVANAADAANYIYKHRRCNFEIRYYPRFWKFISVSLLLLPWSLYKKIKF